MRLSKLELHGFKSFADHTALVFDAGVTAIVGPNGCGKSNVSDAIRWVLGEQRARMMRGAKMEEVIFQGSSARRAVSLAEVSLHFENDNGVLPLPFREVVITRRLSRTGESDYFLNRAPCRLRDIHDILRGTGLGTETGVVIESKMVDALLSDRPDDRRELFEEAAGVGLYRDRRRSTARRLDETTVDLQRLDDLVAEVQSQVRSLARQRTRAQRHAELTARRYTVDMALAAREIAASSDELGRLETSLTHLRASLPDSEAAVRAAEAARDAAQRARAAAEEQRADWARRVGAQREQALQLQAEMAVAEERQRNATARRQRAEEERREGESHRLRLASEVDDASTARAAGERLLADAARALEARALAEAAAHEAVAAARAALTAAEREAREIDDRLRRAALDGEAAQHEVGDLAQRAAVVTIDRDQLADRAMSAERELAEARDALAISRDRAAVAAATATGAQHAAGAARERESAARSALVSADDRVTALAARIDALETLERERVGLAPAAARLLKERAAFGEGAILGPLSDFISADEAGAALVERFLGPTVHAVLVRDQAVAAAVSEWHGRAHPGPLLLLPVDAPADRDDRPAGGAMGGLVTATAPGDAWVRTLLAHVRASADGRSFVDARGAVWLPGTAAGPGPLRRRAELSALTEALTEARARRAEAALAAEESRAALVAADTASARDQEAASAAARDARRAAEQVTELERRVERSQRELGEADATRQRLDARREQLAAKASTLVREVEALRTALAEHEAAVAERRARVRDAEQRHEDARDQWTRMQVEQAQALARLQVAGDHERRLAHEAAAATARLDALHAELATLSDADLTLREQMDRWRAELGVRTLSLSDGETRLAAADAAVADANDETARAEHTVDDARRRATGLAETLHRAELRYTELAARRTAIRERLEGEWRKPLADMLADAVTMDGDDDDLRREADALRSQLEQLGPVNVLAIEEYEETAKRLDFLSAQRTDLADAKQSLLQAIREIDTTARDLFLATFAAVRDNFRQIFLTLFGGGECDLRLENVDAPLDCDIEIHASPRGKRTQRIHLLSSGERALVALSLLFGLFLTKPSPFCLLDEVDAPLDDANIGRFVRMLNQFKQRTQFIVITHNPRTTTEAADAVYGVTMQEPGVSSLISVRMHGAALDAAEETGAVAVAGD